MCASLRPSLRLILNAAGVQFTPLSILQTHALDRERRRPSFRRIDRRTPLPDRGGRCRDRPLARLHRADSRGPHRTDAFLRTNARRSRETAAPVVDSRARTASGGNGQNRPPHVLTRGAGDVLAVAALRRPRVTLHSHRYPSAGVHLSSRGLAPSRLQVEHEPSKIVEQASPVIRRSSQRSERCSAGQRMGIKCHGRIRESRVE
jgi:hypothetical protein